MNYMVNLMREHIPESARIHYVITQGGEAPNVVPDFAEVYYYVRHPSAEALVGIWDRVINAAQAAALGTGTTVSIETMHGNHAVLPNEALAKVMHGSLSRVGGYSMTQAEQQFARTLAESFGDGHAMLGLETEVQPLRFAQGKGSTDVGDVSWVVPTTGLNTATWVPGTAAHSWQAIAAGGTSIGVKGMMVAAKSLALTAQTLLSNEQALKTARAEFNRRRGPDYVYQALLGDRAPPLNYRNTSQ
jgi:aminobenzoyl-glutamate utilization protein B